MPLLKSLKARQNELAAVAKQIKVLESTKAILPAFEYKLKSERLFPLKPTELGIFQINVGKMCNQVCEHCHVDAGPDRQEIMTQETMQLCLHAIDKTKVHTVDLTGGAPEMNPDFKWFVTELSKRNVKVIVRSNLTILVANKKYYDYPQFFKDHNVTVIASLPCYTQGNVDKQRGKGVFADSIKALQILNKIGYSKQGSGLELNLVYNPGGASLPGSQMGLETDYKKRLKEDFDIEFNSLYTITNLPISRFLDYLIATNKYEQYMELLVNSFNSNAVEGLMCKNTLSVSWDGYLYDCDFNQMLEMQLKGEIPKHIKDFDLQLIQNREIATNQHCYGCTAGAGSSCQGSLTN